MYKKESLVMDLGKLSDLLMEDVKESISKKYFIGTINRQGYIKAIDMEGNKAIINMSGFSATVIRNNLESVTNYQFLKTLGEIFSYYKFEANDDNSLNITHGRCVADKEQSGTYHLMAKSANVNNFTNDLDVKDIIAFPYPYFGVTLDETLKLLSYKTDFNVAQTDAEYVFDVKAEDIFAKMQEITKVSENKLKYPYIRVIKNEKRK